LVKVVGGGQTREVVGGGKTREVVGGGKTCRACGSRQDKSEQTREADAVCGERALSVALSGRDKRGEEGSSMRGLSARLKVGSERGEASLGLEVGDKRAQLQSRGEASLEPSRGEARRGEPSLRSLAVTCHTRACVYVRRKVAGKRQAAASALSLPESSSIPPSARASLNEPHSKSGESSARSKCGLVERVV